jgi:AcrR family transcriptional regulator
MSEEEERDAILDAAIACFMEIGYDASSLAAIAMRCALPETAVRRFFPTKADVRSALFALWSERLSAWICYA